MPVGLRYSLPSPSFASPTFPTHYLAMSSTRCRRSPAQRGALRYPRRAARSHRARKSRPPTTRRRCSRRTTARAAGTALPCPTRGAHARPRGQRWWQRKRKWRRTETPQFGVLLRTHRCCGASSWQAGPQLVRGARGAPERHPGRDSASASALTGLISRVRETSASVASSVEN